VINVATSSRDRVATVSRYRKIMTFPPESRFFPPLLPMFCCGYSLCYCQCYQQTIGLNVERCIILHILQKCLNDLISSKILKTGDTRPEHSVQPQNEVSCFPCQDFSLTPPRLLVISLTFPGFSRQVVTLCYRG